MASSITSANAVFTLMATNMPLYPAPVKLECWAVDNGWSSQAAQMVESSIGVDGCVAYAFIPFTVKMGFAFLASSDSVKFFQQIIEQQIANKDVIILSGSLTIPSTGWSYVLTGGALTEGMVFPSGKKSLSEMTYSLEWERVRPALI